MLEPAFLEAARRLIAADSVTERGNLRAVEVLEPLCREAGLQPVRMPAPDTGERDANLLAGPGGGDGATGAPLLLVTHLDTVDPGPRDAWRTDPFVFTLDGELAYGLGVADVKLDALCKLWAARRLKGAKLARPFWFLGTYGEEAGLRGASRFVHSAPFRPAFALCGEPSELVLCHAHKGYAVVRVRLQSSAPRLVRGTRLRRDFAGRAAHSSTPHLGQNAVDLALDALAATPGVVSIRGGESTNTIPARCEAVLAGPGQKGPPEVELSPLLDAARDVQRLWQDRVSDLKPKNDGRFDPDVAVANLTFIRGGDGVVELTLDARLLPAHDPQALLAGFKEDVGAELGGRMLASVWVERCAAGMGASEQSVLVQRASAVLARLGLDPVPRAKPTSTEAGVFARAGIEAAVFGPSRSTGNAHTPNEVAQLAQVSRAIDVYEALIREVCGA